MNKEIEQIEKPMKMNYRESVAWQLGYNMGWEQCRKHMIDKVFNKESGK